MTTWILLAAAGALAVAWVSVMAHWILVRRRFVTVSPGRVYRSGELRHDRLQAIVSRYDIRTVIDLRRGQERVDREHQFLAGLGVVHVNVPAKQVPSDANVASFLRALQDAEQPLLIHCRHGAGRARLYAALYLIEHEGWSNDRAARTLAFHAQRKREFLRGYVVRSSGREAGTPAPQPVSASLDG